MTIQKKLKFAWRIAQLKNEAWVGIDTGIPNRLVKEALLSKSIFEFADYATIQPKQKYGKNSRVDFLLTHTDQSNTYVEVKNVHLWRGDDWAEFPDTVTARGLKHLGVLGDMAEAGHMAVLLYYAQHTACARCRLAMLTHAPWQANVVWKCCASAVILAPMRLH
ncbi:MAG: DNA/RNA nuclease SfsA, partial [Planktomarina sp.]|nr:DNA/RNA nuclease SfsA [Planktomarina sp.]